MDSNTTYETIVKKVFDLNCKRYLEEQKERLDWMEVIQLESRLEQVGYEKKLIEKQSEFVHFKKEIYEELIEKFKKQNQLLNRVEFSLKTKTKILLKEKLERLQAELQKSADLFYRQDNNLEREQAKMLNFMEKNFNQTEMKNVRRFIEKYDAFMESETNDLQAKLSQNPFENSAHDSQFSSQCSNNSAGSHANTSNDNLIKPTGIPSGDNSGYIPFDLESRYNSQGKRETCIIKPLASLDSGEAIPQSKAESNNEKVEEKREPETTKTVLTTEIVEVTDEPPIEKEVDLFKMPKPKPIEVETLQPPNSPVVKKARIELPIGKNGKKNKFEEAFTASFNFKLGDNDFKDVSKEKSAGFFMMTDEDEDNSDFNELFNGRHDSKDVSKEKSAAFFMMADEEEEEDNIDFNELFIGGKDSKNVSKEKSAGFFMMAHEEGGNNDSTNEFHFTF